MSSSALRGEPEYPSLPASSFNGPMGELISRRFLSPPTRPGLAAVLDRFEILHVLGRGGMGLVFLARDPQSNRNVAIKIVRPEIASDEQMVRRFVKEADHMQKLGHPNIASVLEISPSAPGAYFVMPYYEGGNLSRWIKEGGIASRDFILSIAAQIGEALHFAHRRGIIHRDLKPANVLLDRDQRAHLADFGLARTMFNDTVVDVEGQQAEGTPPYMSPAVAAGQAEDTRCDIYAFGALLYEMLTGVPPYSGASTREIRLKILSGDPRPILLANPHADRLLAAVATGAMGRELRERYADMADVLGDLKLAREGRPPRGPRGLGRVVRRKVWSTGKRRTLTIAAAGLGLALLASAAIWTYEDWFSAAPSAPTTEFPRPAFGSEPLYFGSLVGIAAAPSGRLFVADQNRCAILQINPQGQVGLEAGDPGVPGLAQGRWRNARFSILRGIAAGPNGSLFATDGFTIRKIDSDRNVSLLAGYPGLPGSNDGLGPIARFRCPSSIAVGPNGQLYVADTYTIREVSPWGAVRTIAGLDGHAGTADGVGSSARFSDEPKAIAVGRNGTIYVADTLNCTLRRISPGGTVTTLAGLARSPGSADGEGPSARFFRPEAVAVGADGTIYVADTFNHIVRKVTPLGFVKTLAGTPGQPGNRDGALARFDLPTALALTPGGDLLAADSGNHNIRLIHADGTVSTLDGTLKPEATSPH